MKYDEKQMQSPFTKNIIYKQSLEKNEHVDVPKFIIKYANHVVNKQIAD
jgi:hypothetical protein